MSRKAKYATLTKYKPYIDIIRRDLSIPDDVWIDIQFSGHRRIGGYAYVWSDKHAKIRVSKYSDHNWVIQSLMHEMKHVQQGITGRLEYGDQYYWLGTPVELYTAYDKDWKRYKDQPWEKEAWDYQKEHTRLFPNDALPAIR